MRGVLVSMDNELRDYIVNFNALSKDVFGEECRISSILKSTNFSQEQITYLQGKGLNNLMQNIDFALRVYLISYSNTSKNCDILYQRYGLFGYKKQTLEHIGEQYGVSRERIRQLQAKTLKLLNKKRFPKMVIVAACQTLKIDVFETLADKIETSETGFAPDDRMSGAIRKKKQPFSMTSQMLSDYVPAETPLSLNEFVKILNNLKEDNMKKLKYRTVINFLINEKLLETYINSKGVERKRPTELGLSAGILTEERNGSNGTYTVILYNQEAQKFLIDSMEVILTGQEEIASEAELQGSPWTPAQEECMVDLFQKNVSISEIAVTLKRTPEGIRARLKKLGLIEHRNDAE